MVNRIRNLINSDQRGVALVVVLLFAVLLMMLVATMLAVGGTQVSISGTQRDSARALERAQAGVEEGIRRVEANRAYSNPFGGSVDPTSVQVEVVPRRVGPNGQIIEIQGAATVGVARRRLSVLALAVSKLIPPKIMYGHNFSQQGNAAEVGSGDVYAQTYVEFVIVPDQPDQFTYSGWGIRKKAPFGPYSNTPCYTHAECMAANPPDADRWYPGQRRTAYEDIAFNLVIPASTDTRVPKTVLNFACPGGPVPAGTIGLNGPGFQAGDRRGDLNPADPLQAAIAAVPLYGCTPDGLPYTWVREVFYATQEFVAPWDPACTTATCEVKMWFQAISFERWFNSYWVFDEPSLEFDKAPALAADPSRGAIPPFPPFAVLEGNPDTTQVGGGTINDSSGINFGTCVEGSDGVPNNCDSLTSDPQTVLLDCAPPGSCTYTVNGTLDGHGLLLIDGDLVVNGTFNYWGTVIVNGNLTLGAGNVTVYGGIVAKSTAWLTGNITVYAGTSVSNVLVGPATVTVRSWRER